MPRPPLATVRISDGTALPLDRPLLVGRAPVEQDGFNPFPHLITVPSPHRDISRTHLAVAPHDWSVVVTDLHSTNGTLLITDPSSSAVLLKPGEPTPIPIGSSLELGDGITVTIEAPE